MGMCAAKNKPMKTLTTEAVRKMIKPWLTGDDERDARNFRRTFRSIGFSVGEWRQVVAEAKACPN